MTYLLPTNLYSTRIVQSIMMYPKLKDYILHDKMTFEQYLLSDIMFRYIMILFHAKLESEWIGMVVDSKH